MIRILNAVCLLLASLSAVHALTKLEEIYGNAYSADTKILNLSPAALQSAKLAGLVNRLSGAAVTSIEDAFCKVHINGGTHKEPKIDPNFVECTGKMNFFDKVTVASKIVIAELDSGEIAMQLDVDVKTHFDDIILQKVSGLSENDSFLQSVKLGGGVGARMILGSHNFLYGRTRDPRKKMEVKKELFTELTGPLVSTSAFFNLENSFPIDGAHLVLTTIFPLNDADEIDYVESQATLALKFNKIVLNKAFSFIDAQFSTTLVDLSAAAANRMVILGLESTMHWTPEKQNPLLFTLAGKWNVQTNEVQVAGIMEQDWVHPGGLNWLTLHQGKVVVYVNPIGPNENIVNMDVDARVTLSFSKNPALEHYAFLRMRNNGEELFVHTTADLSVERPSLSSVMTTLAGQDVSAVNTGLTKDFHFSNYELGITFSNFEKFEFRKIDYFRGITITTGITLKESSAVNAQLAEIKSKLLHGISSSIKYSARVFLAFEPTSYDINPAESSVGVQFQLGKYEFNPKFYLSKPTFYLSVKNFESVGSQKWTLGVSSSIVMIPQKGDPVEVFGSGNWQIQENKLELKGEVRSRWENVLGIKWLTIHGGSMFIAIHQGNIRVLKIDGTSYVSFGGPGVMSRVIVHSFKDFQNNFVRVNGHLDLLTPAATVRGLTGNPNLPVSTLEDLRYKKAVVALTVSDFAYEYPLGNNKFEHVPKGLSLGAAVVITPASALDKRLEAFYKGRGEAGPTMTMSIFLPFGTTDGIKFKLRSPSMPINPSVSFEGAQFKLALNTVSTIGVSGAIKVKFDNQPNPIRFSVAGDISTVLEVVLSGAMDGRWTNVFGLPGFDLEQVWGTVGLQPFIPPITQFGMGSELRFGRTVLGLQGILDFKIVNPLEPHRGGPFATAYIRDMPLNDVASAYNKVQVTAAHHHGRSLASVNLLNEGKFPPFLRIKELFAQFASYDKVLEIDQVVIPFEKGLTLKGDIHILGIPTCKFFLHTHFDGLIPNFTIRIDINWGGLFRGWVEFIKRIFPQREFQEKLALNKVSPDDDSFRNYLDDISQDIPQLIDVRLAEFDLDGLASGSQTPFLQMDILYRNKTTTFSSNMALASMGDDLPEVMDRMVAWKDINEEAQCMVNKDCPGSQKCYHQRGSPLDNTCVDSCGALGEVSIFGCLPCQTNAECRNSDAGNFCSNGQCQVAGEGQYTGSCLGDDRCNSPNAGCIMGYCTTCSKDVDCLWSGAGGQRCINNKCQA